MYKYNINVEPPKNLGNKKIQVDHPGHSCSYQITIPDIRAHINFISFIYSLHAYPLLLIA